MTGVLVDVAEPDVDPVAGLFAEPEYPCDAVFVSVAGGEVECPVRAEWTVATHCGSCGRNHHALSCTGCLIAAQRGQHWCRGCNTTGSLEVVDWRRL